MIALLQRVSEAAVRVDGEVVGEIGAGLLLLLGVERDDSEAVADRLLQRVLGYRVFADANDKMNLSLHDTQGCLLIVPQFTLPADTRKGTRPSFTPAASPEAGRRLFDYFTSRAENLHPEVERGRFGANMQVALINDGPVTFWLQVSS